MARKTGPSKFTGALAEPIVIPFDFNILFDATTRLSFEGFAEQIAKMKLLEQHYNTDNASLLALLMAIDLVPGFHTVYQDPLAAALGLPTLTASSRAGTGVAPELHGDRLLDIIEKMKAQGIGSDKLCAERIFELFWPKPPKRMSVKERRSAVRTIQKRITAAKLKKYGPLKRSSSKTA